VGCGAVGDASATGVGPGALGYADGTGAGPGAVGDATATGVGPGAAGVALGIGTGAAVGVALGLATALGPVPSVVEVTDGRAAGFPAAGCPEASAAAAEPPPITATTGTAIHHLRTRVRSMYGLLSLSSLAGGDADAISTCRRLVWLHAAAEDVEYRRRGKR
jgi:hypothetical protein